MKQRVLIAITGFALFYVSFIHRSRELPLSVVDKGIRVIESIEEIKLSGFMSYNPGVLDLGDRYLLVSREKAKSFWRYVDLKLNDRRRNVIKLVEIDENFKQISPSMQILPQKGDELSSVTDPRLFWHEGKVFMIFCDHSKGGSVQMLAELKMQNRKWHVASVTPLVFEGNKEFIDRKLVQKGIEKNWMPFSKDGKLFIVYLLEPEKVVLEADIETGKCWVVSRTDNELSDKFAPLRGGTPPVYDDELGQYLTLYHIAFPGRNSFTTLPKNIYIAGAYSFTNEAPFEMIKKSKAPFYQQDLYNSREKIVFPTALIKKGDHYLMFYGEDDCKIKVAKIKRKRLLETMKGVEDASK